MREITKKLLPLVLILSQVSPAMGDTNDAFQYFEEEARVVTASRRPQEIRETPLAVDVITPDEIKASGAVNVWDLLRFRAGMDVLDGRSSDGNRAIVSARGFPHENAGNLLVLVDGRSVYDANGAGVKWEQIPVQMQDIDRIEIVRGPNTALYGTGAGVGVVNILTKKPQGKTSLELDNRGGHQSLVQSFQAVEGAVQNLSLRVSHTFQQESAFPMAADSAVAGGDFLHKNVANVRAALPLTDRSKVELLSGGTWETVGLGGGTPAGRDDVDVDFQMLRFSQEFSSDASLEATSSRNDSRSIAPPGSLATDLRQLQYDAEILYHMAWWDRRLNTTLGTSYRHVQVTSPPSYGSLRPLLEIRRGYFQQNIKLVDEFSLQGGLSLESSDWAGIQPNYQVSALYASVQEHTFRASYSVATILRDFFPIFADYSPSMPQRFQRSGALASTPYKVRSYETGYSGAYWDKRLQADANLFYTYIANNHQSFVVLPPPVPLVTTVQFRSYDDAISRGAELSLKCHFSRSRWIYANYTYEQITDTAGDQAFITKNTPAHKVNFGGATDLVKGLTASVNVGYKDAYLIQTASRGTPLAAPAYWRMDTRLAYELPWYKDVQIYVAGQNILESVHVEFADGLSVPRTYQGGVTVKFGGDD